MNQTIDTTASKSNKANSKCLVNFCPKQRIKTKFSENKNESDKMLAVYQTIETKALKSNRADSKCLVHFCPYQTKAI